MKKTAVIILNWNGKSLLEEFLPALVRHTPADDAEIIVADNASSDDSLAVVKATYPDITIFPFTENHGFAGGYNRAMSGLENEYVVLLNSDVEVTEGWLTAATDYLDVHPDVAALQPKILSYRHKTQFEYAGASGGYIDKYGYPFCRGRILDTLETDHGQYDTPVEVFWASGACLFVRLKAYWEVGGLDELFFAHQEEIDLCWRLHTHGKKVAVVPQSVIYHLGGGTLKPNEPRKVFLNSRNNLLMLYKNLPTAQYWKVMFIRFFLDYAAAASFFAQRKPQQAFAIFAARRDFHRKKEQYKLLRKQNLNTAAGKIPPTIYQKSMLWQYYLHGKKRFADFNKMKKKNPMHEIRKAEQMREQYFKEKN
ncbi:glycosyl transferase [Bacteroidia bacterium]|nr:glycosyl transferase [Bacteroidia bacterium]